MTLSLNTADPDAPIFSALLAERGEPLPEFDAWDPDYVPHFQGLEAEASTLSAAVRAFSHGTSSMMENFQDLSEEIARLHQEAREALGIPAPSDALVLADPSVDEALVQARAEHFQQMITSLRSGVTRGHHAIEQHAVPTIKADSERIDPSEMTGPIPPLADLYLAADGTVTANETDNGPRQAAMQELATRVNGEPTIAEKARAAYETQQVPITDTGTPKGRKLPINAKPRTVVHHTIILPTEGVLEPLPDTLLDIPIQFWVCPIPEHGDRHDENGKPLPTVEWVGDVARCLAPGCENTNRPTETPGKGE